MRTIRTKKEGYTLVELILVIVLIGIIAGVTAPLINMATETYVIVRDRRETFQKASLAMKFMEKEIENAEKIWECKSKTLSMNMNYNLGKQIVTVSYRNQPGTAASNLLERALYLDYLNPIKNTLYNNLTKSDGISFKCKCMQGGTLENCKDPKTTSIVEITMKTNASVAGTIELKSNVLLKNKIFEGFKNMPRTTTEEVNEFIKLF